MSGGVNDGTRVILADLKELDRTSVTRRKGVVTATDPLSVALGGSDTEYAGVYALASAAPLAVDDVVSCLVVGPDLLVLGRITQAPGMVCGEVAANGAINRGSGFTVSHPSTGHYVVTFDVALDTIPTVVATVGSSASYGSVKHYPGTAPTTGGFEVTTYNPGATSSIDLIWDFVAVAS